MTKINGILVYNKEKGISSNKAINKVKKLLNLEKVGHIGTLDPEASGVLPILINEATKLSDILINKDKSYLLEAMIGVKTDTLDMEGKILEEEIINDINFNKDEFIKSLDSWKCTYEQTPPIYSAIKKNGKKLYQYALENKEVVIPTRKVNIYNIEYISSKFKDNKFIFSLKIHVSKGFYVRSFVRDLANKFNHFATLINLKRTSAGAFNIENSYTYDEISNKNYKIISLEEYYKDKEKIFVNEYMEKLIYNGIYLDERQIKTNDIFLVYNKLKNLIAIYMPLDKYKYKPLVVLR